MRILFLCLSKVWDISNHDIYEDLLREFAKYGNEVYVVTPVERKYKEKTTFIQRENVKILKIKTLNIQKTNIIEKGIGTLLIGTQYKRAIKKFFKGIKFDLVLYATPPITLHGVVKYMKKRDRAATYLLLKDIFPQNAVDLGMMKKTGWKGLLYRSFRRKEKQLYALSDHIGCMSQANVDYLLKENPEIPANSVEISPNCMEFRDLSFTEAEKIAMRQKYGLPLDKTIFVYGGNLGKPQGIPFLIECLKAEADNSNAFFLIVGDGTEYEKLETFVNAEKPAHVRLMKRLPKEDYDHMIAACDIGLIFLDHRFTIPNFPSRVLAYMQAGLPILACTDPNTDIGTVITEGGFGWWCESNSTEAFDEVLAECMNADLKAMGEKALRYLEQTWNVEKQYANIVASLKKLD